MKNSAKQLVLTTQSILKFVHYRRETIGVEVRVRVVLRRSSLGHEAQPGEVAFLTLDLLILFRARGVFTREVEVAQDSICLGHGLLDILLLVSEAILLLVVVLVVILVVVVVLLD
jgi:hypothetical protein